MKNIFITIFFCFAAHLTQGKCLTRATTAPGNQAPLSFIENNGQITDQNQNQRADIQFRVAASPGLNIFIGNGAIHYQFSLCDKPRTEEKKNAMSPQRSSPENVNYTMYRMDVVLIGADKNAQVITEEKQRYHENYFTSATTGKHGVTANSYNKVTYKDIYPHIDWVLYTSNGKLEYEFVVNEGGNVADIQLKYCGATALQLTADGSLAAITPQGNITEEPPYTYQKDGKQVKSNFKLNGNVLTYETGNYTGPVVIDPALEWATYYGGNNRDGALRVAVDASGNVFMTGQACSSSNIATAGAYQDTLDTFHGTLAGNGADAFLAKFNSGGNILWATYYGGNGDDAGRGLAIDSYGNVYITGTTDGTTGIATTGAYQDIFGGNEDAFLAKFNGAGSIQWATYFGGSNVDEGLGIAIDADNNIYMTGATFSDSGIATPGSYQPYYSGTIDADAFIAKFNSSGGILWSTYFGGTEGTQATGVAIDGAGNIYITGSTGSTSGIATVGAYQVTYGGDQTDAFIAKFNSFGGIQWASYFGGSGQDEGYGIVAADTGNVYITGFTVSTSSIATPGAYQTVEADSGTGSDAFIAKFNSSGNIQWATYYGGNGVDNGYGIAIDGAENVYITGWTNGTTGIATAGAYQGTYGGGLTDAFLAKFSSAGIIQFATYYGGSNDDLGTALATDGTGYVYVTGGTNSLSGIATPGAYQTVEADSSWFEDAFLAKFSSFGSLEVNNTLLPPQDFDIYPNPTQNSITISSQLPVRNIVISNLAGQTVFTGSYYSSNVVISLAQLPAGIYLVSLNDSKVYKVIRQ